MKAIDTSALVEFLLNTERFAAASDYFDDELIAAPAATEPFIV